MRAVLAAFLLVLGILACAIAPGLSAPSSLAAVAGVPPGKGQVSGAAAASRGIQDAELASRLAAFDASMGKLLSDWNAPGVGVGIVVGDRLVFAKGYGYRDYAKRLPFTPRTLCQIASNTKLFTAVAAGMLVEEGKLLWDRPVRETVPAIRFYNDELNNTVTLRDMLSHRTGITRHDLIWYQADLSRAELFARLRFMEPREPLRQVFLYNNMMVAAAGHIVELKSDRSWEDFVRARLFKPLAMDASGFSVAEMLQQADHAVPFTERRDGAELYQIPYYEDTAGMAPCGAIISNLEDMSHWLIALMNDGRYAGRQVIPPATLRATLEPAIALPNTLGETRGFWELLNAAYGMGRETASYRGHLLTYHGGDLDGFHSQVSFMPRERIGVIVLVIGDHCASLYDTVSYNVYERLLGMDLTPWSARWLEVRKKAKQAAMEARARAGGERVAGTRPSHPLADYAGEYVHPAYGTLKVTMKEAGLELDFHKIRLPLAHFHYDRFDTPDDERFGKWSLNFMTDPLGDVAKVEMSLDEGESTFTRRPEPPAPALLARLAGTYRSPSGSKLEVVARDDGGLYLLAPGQPADRLLPYKGLRFRLPQDASVVFEFVMEGGEVKALQERDPAGEYRFVKQ